MSKLAKDLAREKLRLHINMTTIGELLESEKFAEIEPLERSLLKMQHKAMTEYYNVLNHRCYRHANGSWPNSTKEEFKKPQMIASEALYGFMGWLTSRQEVTPELGSSREAGGAGMLVGEFCKANSLDEPRKDWADNLIHPCDE